MVDRSSTKPLTIRFPTEQVDAIDAWIVANHPGASRSEAVRIMIQMALQDRRKGLRQDT